MAIRIGDSACLSVAMITPESRAVESRRYLDWSTEWEQIADKCIREKKLSVTTICLNYFTKDKFYPTEIQWRTYIENTVRVLLSKGANWNNSRIDIINEPTKHVRTNDVPDVEKYLKLEHWAHSQIKGRLPMGSGCDELIYDGWQANVAGRGNAEWYVIHVQGSCDSKSRTDYYVNRAKNRAVSHKKLITCNEGNYKNLSSSTGFGLMKYQAEVCERHGLPEYLNVFNDKDNSAFQGNTDHWDFLCFKIDGNFRNDDAERHYHEWTGLMDSKAPVPNIKEGVNDGMILETLYTDSPYKTAGYLVEWCQMILGELKDANEDPFYEGSIDGKFEMGTKQAVKDFQIYLDVKGYPNIEADGKFGRKMYGWAVEELMLVDLKEGQKFDRLLHKWASPIKKA